MARNLSKKVGNFKQKGGKFQTKRQISNKMAGNWNNRWEISNKMAGNGKNFTCPSRRHQTEPHRRTWAQPPCSKLEKNVIFNSANKGHV